MDKSEFMTALEKSFENDCNQLANLDIPDYQNTPNYQLSKKFKKKMAKLIDRQKQPYFVFISTAGRRVASFIIIIFVMMAASSIGGVKAVPKISKSLVVKSFSDHISLSVDDRKIYSAWETTIRDEYEVYDIPDGFELTESKEDLKVYRNYDTGEFIRFRQGSITTAVELDTVHSTIEFYVDENNQDYVIHDMKALSWIGVYWTDGDYMLSILSNLDKNTVIDLCKHTKKKAD